ncbi:MAG: ABC transporter ATP-binding protein [bacterium]|jgi:zinc transport system ATP-binding protein
MTDMVKPAETEDPIVRVSHVWVYMGEALALKDVSLVIERGKFIGLMGPNGGGKTTLIKTIVGLIKPDRGEVVVRCPAGKAIGYVPQEEYIDPDFPVTAADVVEMGLYGSMGAFPRTTGEHRARIFEALDMVGMKKHAARSIGSLSGGEKQRVSIARAIVGRPSLLLLDEPTTGVDADARDAFFQILRDLRGGLALTIVLASHDIEVVPAQVDEVVCINQRVFVHAAPEEIEDVADFRSAYGCEFEFLAHGKIPHRIIGHHRVDEAGEGGDDA